MGKPLLKFFSVLGLVLIFFVLVGYHYNVRAAEGSINVHMTVPGGGTVPLPLPPPTIANVASTTSFATATVSWKAESALGIQNCTFNYGVGAYSSSSIPGFIGSNFSVDLNGLSPETGYIFKINCLDQNVNSTLATGSFLTLSEALHNLTILAKPEKRIGRAGGNLAVEAILLVYDPVLGRTVYNHSFSLSNTGSTTFQNVDIPAGDNLEAILKGQSHLAKKIVGVNITSAGDVTLDFTDGGITELLAGDVQGTGLKDNFIDILDVSAVDENFNSSNPEADLNRDGIVDVLDMSALLVNYNKQGDPIPQN